MSQPRSTLWDFENFEQIGSGSFGVVYKVKRKKDNKIYALKQVALSSQQQYNETVKEVNILASLNHKHIVRYYDCFSSDNYTKLNIVMEYAKHGTLHDMIKKQNGKPLPEQEIWRLFYHMLLALQYIHAKKILHRDIKAMNVFLDENMDCKLGDFGVSKILDRPMDLTATIIGTPLYMSPELCMNIPYDARSDVWALGCILYEMCTLLHPFEHAIVNYIKNPLALAQAVTNGTWDRNALSQYSPDMLFITEQCLATDPNRRPKIDQLLESEQLKRQLVRYGIIAPSVVPHKSPSSSQEGTELVRASPRATPPSSQSGGNQLPAYSPVPVVQQQQQQPIQHQMMQQPQQQMMQQQHMMQQQKLPAIQPMRLTPIPAPQKPHVYMPNNHPQQQQGYAPNSQPIYVMNPTPVIHHNQQQHVMQQQQQPYYQPQQQQQPVQHQMMQQQQQPVYQNVTPSSQVVQPSVSQKTEACPFCNGSKRYESGDCGACSGQGYIYV